MPLVLTLLSLPLAAGAVKYGVRNAYFWIIRSGPGWGAERGGSGSEVGISRSGGTCRWIIRRSWV
jgi:hypothetical protein